MSRHESTKCDAHKDLAVKDAPTISVASMAKVVVKSSQEMGSLDLRPVKSSRMMRMVTQKQRPHVNMHHVQKDSVLWPADITKLKVIQEKITCSIRTMLTAPVRDLKSGITMMICC